MSGAFRKCVVLQTKSCQSWGGGGVGVGAGLLIREGGLMAFDCSKGGVKSELGSSSKDLTFKLSNSMKLILYNIHQLCNVWGPVSCIGTLRQDPYRVTPHRY